MTAILDELIATVIESWLAVLVVIALAFVLAAWMDRRRT